MALIDFVATHNLPPALPSGEIVLRAPQISDYEQWRALREGSRAHLTQWEPDWREDDITLSAYKTLVRGYMRAARRGLAAPFFIIRQADNQLVGGLNLINIVHGASRSAMLGYWTGEKFARRGYAFCAVSAALGYAFDILRLNRVEAACQPENIASQALLNKAGFRLEGRARQYLCINGAWRDHLIYALLASDWSGDTQTNFRAHEQEVHANEIV